jgi:hypothetical protein
MSAFREAQADESVMISLRSGPYSPECVEGEFSEVRTFTIPGSSANKIVAAVSFVEVVGDY